MNDRKFNVVIIHSSFTMGGAENMVYELTKCLEPSIMDVFVITLHSPAKSLLEQKVSEAKIMNEFACCEGRVTLRKLIHVYQMIQKKKPNILHAHMSGVIYGLPWILTHKTKMIVTAHTTPDKAFNKRTTKILKFLAKRKKVILVAVSEENQKLMENAYGLYGMVECINNGIDLSRYYKSEHDDFVFINVGRHDDNKNQKFIIEQFGNIHKSYKNTRLVLCGDGPNHEELIEQVKKQQLTDCVIFTGNVGNSQDYYAKADVFLMASHREGLPLTAIEACASGLPIICTDVGGMKNIVRENGFLIQDNDAKQYYRAMKKVLTDSVERNRMAKSSLMIAKEYTAIEMANQYATLYQQQL